MRVYTHTHTHTHTHIHTYTYTHTHTHTHTHIHTHTHTHTTLGLVAEIQKVRTQTLELDRLYLRARPGSIPASQGARCTATCARTVACGLLPLPACPCHPDTLTPLTFDRRSSRDVIWKLPKRRPARGHARAGRAPRASPPDVTRRKAAAGAAAASSIQHAAWRRPCRMPKMRVLSRIQSTNRSLKSKQNLLNVTLHQRAHVCREGGTTIDTRAGAGALTGGRKVYAAQAASGRPVRGGACCTARRTAGNTHEWCPWRAGGQREERKRVVCDGARLV